MIRSLKKNTRELLRIQKITIQNEEKNSRKKGKHQIGISSFANSRKSRELLSAWKSSADILECFELAST